MQTNCKTEKPVFRSWCFGIRKAVPIAALSLSAMIAVAPVTAQTLPGSYVNSWIGNTYGTPAQHIAHDIDNLYVTPSGKVATITTWDEGGANAVLYGPTGAQIGVPEESGTGSWGRDSGEAIFVDDNYLYQVMTQDTGSGVSPNVDWTPRDASSVWKCIRRYNHDGSEAAFTGGKGYDASMLIINSDGSRTMPTGVVICNNELYVSEPVSNQIKVYNATTMSQTPVRSFAKANAGLLDYDRLGFIWMLDRVQKKLIRFSSTGAIQSQVINFPSDVDPTSFCIDKVNDRILVTNNGDEQNVLIYTDIFGTPSETSTFGITGGINSGVAGAIAPLKFSEPRGVGIDSSGNIFVGNNGLSGGGARLEKYNSSGTLQWRLNGLVFTANGDINPANESEFYTHNFKFNLNLGNTTPGSEWSAAAMTVNKVKYPYDVRAPLSTKGGFWTTAYVRNVAGRKLLFTSTMVGDRLAIYRFNSATDGETAIPSGLFENIDDPETIWRDANGNGSADAGETASHVSDHLYSEHVFPDSNGGIWKANRGADEKIRYFPMQGFDAHGNPQYSFDSSTYYTLPEIFDVKRLEYDAPNNVLYATGFQTSQITEAGAAGNRMVRYNNMTGTRTTAWSVALPYAVGSDLNVKAFCEAGDYLFLITGKDGRIYVHRKTTGAKVGEIMATSSTGNEVGWSDINGAIRATRRSNGEYLIFAEENGYGKVMMYRWNPTAGVGSISGSSVDTGTPINLTTLGTLDWTKWGVSTNVATVVRKSGGGSKISNYTKIGTGPIVRYTDSLIRYTWTGGTPTASGTNNRTGLGAEGVETGYSFTVPADTTTRTLKVYVGGWNSTGQLTATLSDGSAATYTASPAQAAGDYNKVYTITYKAASASKLLTVQWKMTAGVGDCTLQAATLQ